MDIIIIVIVALRVYYAKAIYKVESLCLII